MSARTPERTELAMSSMAAEPAVWALWVRGDEVGEVGSG